MHCLVLTAALDIVPGATIGWLLAIKAINSTIALVKLLLWIVQTQHGRGSCLDVEELLGADLNPALDARSEINVKILDDLVASKAVGAFLLLYPSPPFRPCWICPPCQALPHIHKWLPGRSS